MLPVVLNAEWVLTDEVLGQLFHRRPSALGLALQRGLAPANYPIVRSNFDQAHALAREKLFDLGNFHCLVLSLVGLARYNGTRLADQEVEINSCVGLHHVVDIEADVAPGIVGCGRLPSRPAARQFLVRHV